MSRVVPFLLLVGVLAACGPKTMQQRMDDSEKIASKADDTMREAEREMVALEPEKAERLLNDARKQLSHPDATLYPEYEMMMDRLKADEARLAEVRAAREKREIDNQVNERRRELAIVIARYEQSFDRLIAKDLTRADLDAYDKTSKELSKELEETPLTKKSPEWKREVADHKELLERGAARTGTARARVAFQEGPGAASVEAKKLLAEERKTKDLDERLAKHKAAVAKLEACAKGQSVIDKYQTLQMNNVWLDGKDASPTAVVKACAKDLPAAKKSLATQEASAAKRRALAEKKRIAEEKKAAAKKAAEERAEAKRKAAEEKKRLAEEKAEAKRRAAEEKKRLAEEKKAEAKRKLEEKAEAKRKAAEERKRKAEEKKAEAKRKLEEKAAAKKKADEERKAAAKKAAEEKKAAAAKKKTATK